MMNNVISKEEFKEKLINELQIEFNVTTKDASDNQFYKALSAVVVDILRDRRRKFRTKNQSQGKKEVYYLSMEFLMGRSLKTSLFNLNINEMVEDVFKDWGVNLERIYEYEPDAGLGNGGLGRLAACYLDGLATDGYPAMGYSICYEYGIFKQKIEEGWQTELPDNWLPGGESWLVPKTDKTIEVHFDGELNEYWDEKYHYVSYTNYNVVQAVPYDMYVPGYGNDAVSVLRLWQAKAPSFDMAMFNQGDYAKALSQNTVAQAISKVLYPNDNHLEGKSLRLRQQYFMCAASIGDIVDRHMRVYGTLDNLHEKVAIHINDTHPTLAIPELMRILLDDCGYSWTKSWHIVTNTFAYTNHTVLAEALEKWDLNLVKQIIPRIFSIIVEINNRYCAELMERFDDSARVTKMSIIQNNQIHMALLCVCASHSVNGVSKLHSDIIKDDVFKNEYADTPYKFKNVTNGIAYRRWLLQSNPGLTKLLEETIGEGFKKNGMELINFNKFENDAKVIKRLEEIKKQNKERFAKYVKSNFGVTLNTEGIFDVQVKRLHEYKRQHLNVLNIISEYNMLLENPDADFVPKTYIFAAKAAPGYYLAKQIIKMIWALGEEIKKNPKISQKLQVFFLEDYRVSLSELLMPAAEISEQISLAGKEASGTGNMKLMLNGALTLGTLDGANIEIKDQVGIDNIFIFGMTADEVLAKQAQGYSPEEYCANNEVIDKAIAKMYNGINGCKFDEVANSLKFKDPYMVLADFDAYQSAQQYASECYKNAEKWNKMSLHNIAGAGIFSADRAVEDYARDIWKLK
ncbi:MAG: glycogen/starch/alpha-glucan phosphorylase [Muribaculaceae bacterium]|nr:glycogen/starch/alpha-glucan phosphorylase [Muribaculaceae bacterium]MCM1478067.1 glycogen/starch/alpha-glucan phosphorylase [Muribaculaceae bacterium]